MTRGVISRDMARSLSAMRWIALAGLPGTGKSTLARALVARLGGRVLSKDEVRAELHGGEAAYTREQDDACFREVLRRAAEGDVSPTVLDGRTFTRAETVHEVVAFAQARGIALDWVECVCAPEVARARLAADAEHPAADRGPELHDRLARGGEPFPVPRLVVRTDEGSPEELAAAVEAELEG